METNRRIPIAAFAAIFAILAVLVPLFAVFSSKGYSHISYNQDIPDVSDGIKFTGYFLLYNLRYFIAIEPKLCVIRMYFDFFPLGTYASSLDQSTISKNVTFYVGNMQQVYFIADRRMTGMDISIPMLSCSPNRYPFDEFKVKFFIAAYENESSLEVPLALEISGDVESHFVTINIDKPSHGIDINTIITRSLATKVFSISVMILMWLLAFVVGLITLTFIYMRFTVELPLIIILTGIFSINHSVLLVALPNIRNAQPDIPSFTVTADIASFFCCMIIINICQMSLLLKFFETTYRKAMQKKEDVKNHKHDEAALLAIVA